MCKTNACLKGAFPVLNRITYVKVLYMSGSATHNKQMVYDHLMDKMVPEGAERAVKGE